MRCLVSGTWVFFCISIENLPKLNDVLSLSTNQVFQSGLSFSKWHLQTACSYRPHLGLCVFAISDNDYMCLRAFMKLLWARGSWELVSPVLLGLQAAAAASVWRQRSWADPTATAMDSEASVVSELVLTAPQELCSYLQAASGCMPSALELHSEICWVFPFHLCRYVCV